MNLEFLFPGGLGDTLTDYTEAWEQQRAIHREVAAGERPGTVLMVEHPPVFTAGKRTQPHERPVDGTPVVDVDRGGKITWHGPGQLVTYPIVRLPEGVYVVDYVRRLEEAMIMTFTELGLSTGRITGRSGVWLSADDSGPERKLAAIGVRVAAKTTMHGVAINVDPDMSWYDRIIPCGIADAGTTSLARELDRDITLSEVAHVFRPYLEEMLTFSPYTQSPPIGAAPDPATTITYGLTVPAV